ncbi:hypothetical protein M9H77_08246 [Catharanthus roseus]|uniref:Uncharacterized protein n=1 Tax=Catharanthus roseus TaxID=4058 RepID=A0ACC0BX97_CATRO|nr:hypothetical protein M9H77_08246 [Catharanthus roseus]
MVDSSCGGTFLHKTADEAWDLFENLSDNSQQHATSSRIGTSRQIGNRGMYEVSQNVDLSIKVDALSKKFDQLLALNCLLILLMCKVFVQFALVHLMLSMTVLVLHYFQNMCRNKSMQHKDFTGRTTHTQTRTIHVGEIILISPGGNKEGKVNWASNNINKTNNMV